MLREGGTYASSLTEVFMRREIANELVAASKHMINGIPEEDIDTHMRNLIDQLQRATNRADEYLKEYFSITSVSKEDIRQAIRNDKGKVTKAENKRIESLDESEMERLAEKLADDYCNQLYWISLNTLFQDRIMKNDI